MQQRITPVVLNLIIINVLVFIVFLGPLKEFRSELTLFKTDVIGFRHVEPCIDKSSPTGYNECYIDEVDGQTLALGTDSFKIWQILSSAFMHGGFLHLIMNMFFLYSIGTMVEMVIGPKRFLEYYLFCALVSGLLTALFDPGIVPVVGASGALLGVFVAFAVYYPHVRMLRLLYPAGVEARKVALGIGVISAFLIVLKELRGFDPLGGISHFGHLTGMVAGVGYFYLSSLLNKLKK